MTNYKSSGPSTHYLDGIVKSALVFGLLMPFMTLDFGAGILRAVRGACLLVPIALLAASTTWWSGVAEPHANAAPNGHARRGVMVNTLGVQGPAILGHGALPNLGEPASTYTLLAGYGHKLIRLPLDWGALQPNLTAAQPNLPVNPIYLDGVKAEVAKIKAAGLQVILDLHQGCEWPNGPDDTKSVNTTVDLVCGAGLTAAHVDNVWRQLSTAFRDETAVYAYDLFNEPSEFKHPTRKEVWDPDQQPYSVYQEYVNSVIAAIRANGDSHTIWVESLCCQWFYDFFDTSPNGPWVNDPLNKVVYSQHMYPHKTSEAFDPAKMNPNYQEPPGSIWADLGYNRGFLQRLDDFGNWCGRFSLECSVGEVGWPGDYDQPATASQWNDLGDQWYNKADYYGMDVIACCESSAYQQPWAAYDNSGPPTWYPAPGINRRHTQAEIIEKPQHLSAP